VARCSPASGVDRAAWLCLKQHSRTRQAAIAKVFGEALRDVARVIGRIRRLWARPRLGRPPPDGVYGKRPATADIDFGGKPSAPAGRQLDKQPGETGDLRAPQADVQSGAPGGHALRRVRRAGTRARRVPAPRRRRWEHPPCRTGTPRGSRFRRSRSRTAPPRRQAADAAECARGQSSRRPRRPSRQSEAPARCQA